MYPFDNIADLNPVIGLRGELFALMTISVTFVLATVVSNTPIDGGLGVYLISVQVPEVFGSSTGTFYLLGLFFAALSIWTAWKISRSKLGLGLFAIHDDEDVAEAKGVPTFRYKIWAFAISSGIAGAVGSPDDLRTALVLNLFRHRARVRESLPVKATPMSSKAAATLDSSCG